MTRFATTVGLDCALAATLAPWRAPRASRDPGKVVLDLAVLIAIGGDALFDIAARRAEPELSRVIASDPTAPRLIDTLGCDADSNGGALAATDIARAPPR